MYREHKSIRQCIHFQVILYSNEKYSNLDIYLVNDVISILTVNWNDKGAKPEYCRREDPPSLLYIHVHLVVVERTKGQRVCPSIFTVPTLSPL